MHIADHRIYLNRERTAVVDEADPEASFLLAAEGAAITVEDAERYGLGDYADKKAAKPRYVEDKAVRGPKS